MIEYKTGGDKPRNLKADDQNTRSVWTAMWDGMRGRCPKCHDGKLYSEYLKVADECATCGTELHHHRADDAPAYFVIFIVGHILVPLVLFIEVNFGWPLWVHATLWLPVALVLSLIFLPIVKGTLVGIQWANKMGGFDTTPGVGSGPDPDQDLLELHEANETTGSAQ